MTDREQIAELAQQAAQGSREAFNDLYRLTRDRAYFVAFSITKNEHDALDILQESYLKAWQRIGDFQPPWEFSAWLNQIAGNTAKNFVKQCKPHLFQASEEDMPDLLDLQEEKDGEYIPDAAMDTAETRRLIMEMIDGLPEDQRLCVLMYYYDDIPLKEISAALEIPYSTVMSRMALARKKISNGVEALEKKGAKLYGAAPIPLLIWLLKNVAGESCKNLPPVILGSTAAAAGGIVAGIALPKIIAGIATAVVITGSAITAAIILPKPKPQPPTDGITTAATEILEAHTAETIPISNYLLPLLNETQPHTHTQQPTQDPYAPETQPVIAGSGTTEKKEATTVSSATNNTTTAASKTAAQAVTTSTTRTSANTSATTTTANPSIAAPTRNQATKTSATTTTTTAATRPSAPQNILQNSNNVIIEYPSGALPEGVMFQATTGGWSYTTQIVNPSADTIIAQFSLRCTLNGSPLSNPVPGVTIYLPVPAAELQNIDVLEAQHLVAPGRMDDMSAWQDGGYLVFTTNYLP